MDTTNSNGPKENVIYLKLGEKAGGGIFSDSTNKITISNRQIVKVDRGDYMKSRSATRAKDAGHIAIATKEEFEAYEASKVKKAPVAAPAPVSEVPNPGLGDDAGKKGDDDDDDDEDLTQTELIDALKSLPLTDKEAKDLAKKEKPELLALYKKYKKN